MLIKQLGNANGLTLNKPSSSFLIIRETDKKIFLFDCGHNIADIVIKELKNIAKNWNKSLYNLVSNHFYIFISHLHEDHISNLQSLMLKLLYKELLINDYLINIQYEQNKEGLFKLLCGQKIVDNLNAYLHIVNYYYLDDLKYGKIFNINSSEEYSNELEIEIFEGKHIVCDSYGISIKENDKCIIITGDTKVSHKLEKFFINKINSFNNENVIIFHDATSYSVGTFTPHATYNEIYNYYKWEILNRIIPYHDNRNDFYKNWFTPFDENNILKVSSIFKFVNNKY